jgi:hypothetical protein
MAHSPDPGRHTGDRYALYIIMCTIQSPVNPHPGTEVRCRTRQLPLNPRSALLPGRPLHPSWSRSPYLPRNAYVSVRATRVSHPRSMTVVRGPFGLDSTRGATLATDKTVLVVVHTVTAGTWLGDVVPLLENDSRVQGRNSRFPQATRWGEAPVAASDAAPVRLGPGGTPGSSGASPRARRQLSPRRGRVLEAKQPLGHGRPPSDARSGRT